MKILKLMLPLASVMAMLLALSTSSFATPEYMKKEKKACAACHVQKAPSKAKKETQDLNDTGKCYAKKHSLADCK